MKTRFIMEDVVGEKHVRLEMEDEKRWRMLSDFLNCAAAWMGLLLESRRVASSE